MPVTAIDYLDSIPGKGHVPSSASAIYSCVTAEHMHGFTPIARYGILVDRTMWNTDLARPDQRKKQQAVHYAISYLLLARDGELYVDVLKGTESRGYGLDDEPAKLHEVLLPSEVFDYFAEVLSQPERANCALAAELS